MNIKQHLIERNINFKIHQPILDEVNCCATFLCYNLSGQLCGFQRYNPLGDKKVFNDPNNGKYYTYRNKNYPTIMVWGLESYFINDTAIFITEGIFDAARITKRNHCAIAFLCNNPPKDYKNWLQSLSRPIIAICDNDSAGIKLADFGDQHIIVPNGDLGSASEEYVSWILASF